MAEGKEGEGRRKRGTGSRWKLKSGSWQIEHPALERREVYADEQAADARLEEVNRLVAQKINVGRGQQTVTEWYTEFLAQRARDPGKAARSLDNDQRNVEAYILPAIGECQLDRVDGGMLQALLNAVQDGVRERRGGRHDGTRTAQLVASLLNQAFGKAADLRYIPFNPMRGVDVPTYERGAVIPADEAQLAAVLRCAAGAPHPALWYSYALLGVRRGEPLGWTWANYSATETTIRISQQVQAVGSVLQIVPPKSKASVRTLPIATAHARLLDQQRLGQEFQRRKLGPAYDARGLIFAQPNGAPLWPSTVNHWWYALRAEAGLPTTFKLHHLRHTLSTLVDEAEGVTESLKNAIFGHEAKDMSQHYTKGRIQAMRRVLEQVWERVWAAMDEGQSAQEA